MKRALLLIGFVVIAAGLIAWGTWYGDQISRESQASTNAEGTASAQQQSQIMENFKVEDVSVGTGAEAVNGAVVKVNYVGTLDDGTKFDSSYDHGQPISFVLGKGQVIKGWDLGILGMKVGGKRTLTIPPELGYGAGGYPGVIPPNATLHFSVELVGVSSGTGQ